MSAGTRPTGEALDEDLAGAEGAGVNLAKERP